MEQQTSMRHTPVLLKEVLEMAFCEELGPPQNFWDGTFGRGGHSLALLKCHPSLVVTATDRDHQALA
ncbi:MAG: 16S rRNA (cytosine(1402)-N(4))-methyltransferase, partial [Bdellovibrionales bacterium]|nr:16S rRNA (cytosine(1402)-N(4))-methyltransferase [Bdellovibrionales bacterium]